MPAKKVKPQLATLAQKPPNTDEWLHEVKYDGYRIIALIKHHKVKLFTRNQHDWTDKLPLIAKALSVLPDCIVDGEIIAQAKGISHFELLQNEISDPKSKNIYYKIFDILKHKEQDVTQLSLIERKKLLKTLFKNHKNKIVSPTDYIIGNGERVFKKACTLGLEGIVSKRLDSIYEERRTQAWIKSKCVHEEEFVIAGFTKPKGSRKYFGALILGYYKNKQLIYCGHVGTGFNQDLLASLYSKMKKLAQDQSPLKNIPSTLKTKNITWIKPKLVAQIKFIEQTRQGLLRAPSFLGLRLDKASFEVNQEMPIKLTHAHTVIKPTKNVTKEQMADYYAKISSYILPHLKDRPLSLLRCPASGDQCFFQKNITTKDLSSLEKIIVQDKSKKIHYACANKKADLLHLAQAGVLEFHPWGSKKDKLDKPDRVTFDLDPGANVTWSQMIKSALYVRDVLKALGLKSFVKTTGGKGLHIVVPIMRKYTWQDIALFTKNIAIHIAKENPELFTAHPGKHKRVGKIFVDYLRNTKGATAVAPYSLRAHKDAPVSTPLSWRELKTIKSSAQFNCKNIWQRIAKQKKDPWAGFFQCRQQIKLKIFA